MAIPERDRTDEEWDELNELEIRTAPDNRDSDRSLDQQGEKRASYSGPGRRQDRNAGQKNGQKKNQKFNGPRSQEGRPPEGGSGGEGRHDGRPPKRQHRRPKRPAETTGTS